MLLFPLPSNRPIGLLEILESSDLYTIEISFGEGLLLLGQCYVIYITYLVCLARF